MWPGGASTAGGNRSWPREGSVWSKAGVVGEGQETGGRCGFQGRAVPGCRSGSGGQKWPGSEGQMIGGWPGGKTVEKKDFDSIWTNL